MSLSEETARVAGGGKNTLKTILQKLGVTVGSEKIDQYPALAEKISDKMNQPNLHCWARRTVEKASYTLSEIINSPRSHQVWNSTTYNVTLDFYPQVLVNDLGGVIPDETSRQSVTNNYSDITNSELASLRGKFILDGNDSFYIPETATIKKGKVNSYYGIIASQYQTIIVAEAKMGQWEPVFSGERNTYPDSGIADGYYYCYLGIASESPGTLLNFTSERVTYRGTGTYGEANPCSLTFRLPPKYILHSAYADLNYKRLNNAFPEFGSALDTSSLMTIYQLYGFFDQDGNNTAYTKKSEDGRTITWYNTSNARYQLNDADYIYTFIAFF